jgi:putative component of membrane protein insertase Oxa1/YidC/SpoIIIJ protein YidD
MKPARKHAWTATLIAFTIERFAGPNRARAPIRRWWLNPLAWLALGLIRCYQVLVPNHYKPKCVLTPSCSNYIALAILTYGVRHGIQAGLRRIMRCGVPSLGRVEDWP